MSTSGTQTFNMSRDDILLAALRKIGAIQSGETPNAQIITDASQALNAMVKRWAVKGLHIWTQQEGVIFLQPNQASYVIGTGTTDNNSSTYVGTQLDGAVSSGATSITVSSATGISNGDNIGIVLDTGTTFWTTVSGAPSGATIALASAITGNASDLNGVYAYTSRIVRPIEIKSARRRDLTSNIDIPMIALSRIDYQELPNKTADGVPTQYYYDPRGGANATGLFYVWPVASDGHSAIMITWRRMIEDFSTAANNPDLPQEWLDTIIYNLAISLAHEYDVPAKKMATLKVLADEYLNTMETWDREPESVFFGVNFSRQ